MVPRTLVGSTEPMRKLLDEIARVGPRPWPVLILGETGTGKELVARTIHSHSAGPFVVIDCSSLVGALMESELFGHVNSMRSASCRSTCKANCCASSRRRSFVPWARL